MSDNTIWVIICVKACMLFRWAERIKYLSCAFTLQGSGMERTRNYVWKRISKHAFFRKGEKPPEPLWRHNAAFVSSLAPAPGENIKYPMSFWLKKNNDNPRCISLAWLNKFTNVSANHFALLWGEMIIASITIREHLRTVFHQDLGDRIS